MRLEYRPSGGVGALPGTGRARALPDHQETMYDLGVIRRILVLQLVLHGPQDCVGVMICKDLWQKLRSDEGGGEETTQDCPK